VTQSLFRQAASWILPHQLFMRYVRNRDRQWQIRTFAPDIGAIRKLVAPNAVFQSIHQGQRCFILCNGPSVREQNLVPLEHEIVISVSNGYHHPDFGTFKPRYHCVPQITYGRVTEDDVVLWFAEMDSKLGDAELFLNYTEEPLVKKHGLFAGRKVHYLFLFEQFDQIPRHTVPDIASSIPAPQSVALMAIMVALYMGFSDLYLLGVDHDHFKTRRYEYFYEPTVLKGKDFSVRADGTVTCLNFDLFQQLLQLWRQYRIIGQIAAANGAHIWNATAGGELDEFPRVKLADIVGG
jgi:hypothetical protein